MWGVGFTSSCVHQQELTQPWTGALGHELQGQGRGSARDLREMTGLPVCNRLVPGGRQSLQMAGQGLKIHVAHRSRKAGCAIHSLASCPQWRALAKGLRGSSCVGPTCISGVH